MALPLQILTLKDKHISDTSTLTDDGRTVRSSTPQSHRVATKSPRPIPTQDASPPQSTTEPGSQTSSDNDDAATTDPNSSVESPPIADDLIYVQTSTVPSHFPTHPLPEMQGPFEESMLDAGKKEEFSNYRETDPSKFKGRSRRSLILSQKGGSGNVSYNAQWKADSEAKFHPVMKIMSQVIFGVHLLCQSMAQSVPEVSSILSGFVQELDSFLERVNGDFDMSLKDVSELYRNLSLPLQHVNVFDNLLSDRKYRTQTLEGNIRIDALIRAYSQMMNDYMVDLGKLQESNIAFRTYLARIGEDWSRDSREQWTIYDAMWKNTAIWNNNVKILNDKAKKLGKMLQRCALCVNEFEKRCAAAARRAMSRTSSRSSASRSSSGRKEKPLPALPNKAETAVSSPSTPLRQVMNADSTPSRSVSTLKVRPKPYKNTGTGKLQPRDKQRAESTAELAAFFRSVPPPNDYNELSRPSQDLDGRLTDGVARFVHAKRSRANLLSALPQVFPNASSRPSTASSAAPKHIPLSTLMQKTPNTSSSDGSAGKMPSRFDSAVPSGRQSRQSQKNARGSAPHSRKRFAFHNPFKR